MKVFVGLGNPGSEYAHTRHNIGFDFIDFIAQKYAVSFTNKFRSLYGEFTKDGKKIILLKPQTFMNESGSAVAECMKFYKLTDEDVTLVFDDLDILEGVYKIQKSKYPKVHNGINDIISKTNTTHYTFVRIGIENRTKEERSNIPGKSFVLQKVSFDFTTVFTEIANQLTL